MTNRSTHAIDTSTSAFAAVARKEAEQRYFGNTSYITAFISGALWHEVEPEARQEAQRRYPSRYPGSESYVRAFIAGARWREEYIALWGDAYDAGWRARDEQSRTEIAEWQERVERLQAEINRTFTKQAQADAEARERARPARERAEASLLRAIASEVDYAGRNGHDRISTARLRSIIEQAEDSK